MEIKLKSINKIPVTSLQIKEGTKEAHLIVELKLSTDWNKKRFEFKRFAYFEVEQTELRMRDEMGNEIKPPVEVPFNKIILLDGNNKQRVRFFDESDIENLFQKFKKDIKVSNGYFKGNSDLIKMAAKYHLDNDIDFKRLGIKEFEII